MKNCKNCQYYKPMPVKITKVSGWGICHKFPPIKAMVGIKGISQYYAVPGKHNCKYFMPKNQANLGGKMYCKYCKFFRPTKVGLNEVSGWGTCHRYPPEARFIDGKVAYENPTVSDTNFCGEFKANFDQKVEK